jgi:hypothetical protein
MLLRASKAYEEILGLQDSKTLDALEYLGTTYRQMGKLQEAESTYTRVLEGRTALSGPDHPTTLVTMTRLGGVYQYQGGRYLRSSAGQLQGGAWTRSLIHTAGIEQPCGCSYSTREVP